MPSDRSMHTILKGLSQKKAMWHAMALGITLMAFIGAGSSSVSASNQHVQENAAQDPSKLDWDKVIATASLILETSPRNLDAYLLRARAFHLRGKPVSAITDLRKALALKPGHSPAWEHMSEVYFQLGQHQDALICLGQALKYTTDKAQRQKLEARLRSVEQLGNECDTSELVRVSVLQKLVAAPGVVLAPAPGLVESGRPDPKGKSPPNQELSATAEEARQAAGMGDYELAATLYTKALETAPRDAQCHYDLAVIYEIMRKIPLAVQHYERAVELKPDHIEAMLALGDLNAITLNDSKKALYWYSLAIKSETDPSRRKMLADRMKRFLITK